MKSPSYSNEIIPYEIFICLSLTFWQNRSPWHADNAVFLEMQNVSFNTEICIVFYFNNLFNVHQTEYQYFGKLS
jgi:hypothetical protein